MTCQPTGPGNLDNFTIIQDVNVLAKAKLGGSQIISQHSFVINYIALVSLSSF